MAAVEQEQMVNRKGPRLAEGLHLERRAERTGLMQLMGELLLLKKATPDLRLWMPEVPEGPTMATQIVRAKETAKNTRQSQITKLAAVLRLQEAMPDLYRPKTMIFNALDVFWHDGHGIYFFRLQGNRMLPAYDDGLFTERNQTTDVLDAIAAEADPEFTTHWERHSPSCSVAQLRQPDGRDPEAAEVISGTIRTKLPLEVHFKSAVPDSSTFTNL